MSVNQVLSLESAVFGSQLYGALAPEHDNDIRRILDCNVSSC